MEMGKKISEMDAKILELQSYIGSHMKKDIDEKGSCSVKNQDVECIDDMEEDDHNNNGMNVKAKTRELPVFKLTALDVPKTLKLLHLNSRHALKNGASISIPLDDKVLGDKIMIHLFIEDKHNLCVLEPISGGCMCAYIWHLYKECESANLLGRFRFVNPYEVSHNPKIKLAKKAEILASRLTDSSIDQFVLVPCNVGFHWVLTVIDPHNETVYFLDPLSDEIHREQWMDVVDMAIKLFNVSLGK